MRRSRWSRYRSDTWVCVLGSHRSARITSSAFTVPGVVETRRLSRQRWARYVSATSVSACMVSSYCSVSPAHVNRIREAGPLRDDMGKLYRRPYWTRKRSNFPQGSFSKFKNKEARAESYGRSGKVFRRLYSEGISRTTMICTSLSEHEAKRISHSFGPQKIVYIFTK